MCVSQPDNQYDFLEGIAKRSSHRSFPEPEVAMIFKTSDSEDAIDLWEVERRLQILLKEVCEQCLHCFVLDQCPFKHCLGPTVIG